MKNYIVLLLIAFITTSALAQHEIIKKTDAFTEIKAYDRINTVLIKSSENKVIITGDDQDNVNITNSGGLLKIKMEFKNQLDGNDVTVKVYYTETLTLIDANENASITSDETITGSKIRIAAQEGGKIALKIDVKNVFVKSTSGSSITLNGKATEQEVVANAGGKILNEQLNTKETLVTVNAGGSASVKASDKMNAKVRAGGMIYIYGNPKDLKRNKVFGGKIKLMD